MKKFTKHIHNSGCTTAQYDASKMEYKDAKVVEATFLDHNMLHWLGEYPTLTLQVFVAKTTREQMRAREDACSLQI
jgi:hypothetical protein